MEQAVSERKTSKATPVQQRRHYNRRRMRGCSGPCASYKHAECRSCDCACHDQPQEATKP